MKNDLDLRYSPQKSPISIKRIKSDKSYTHKSTHMHSINELLLITSESDALIFSNGNRQHIKTPALIFHRAGSYHYTDTVSAGKEGYSCYCIYYDEKFLNQIPESLLQGVFLLNDDCLIAELSEKECESITRYASLLLNESDKTKSLFLLFLILSEANEFLSDERAIRLNTTNNYIFDVVQYLTQHFNEPLTTAQISSLFHVSQTKLNNDFYKITNKTLKVFSNDLKLSCAYTLLAETNTKISEIAYLCGFSSESYFIQSLKRNMGMTPNAYRKQKWQ